MLAVFRGIAQFFLDYVWEDSQGMLHTGPTTSPENSYRLRPAAGKAHKQATQAEAVFLSFSPAIDVSVLRQAANVLSVLASAFGDPADLVLSRQLEALVRRLPGAGLPVVGTSGLILEYPHPLPEAANPLCPAAAHTQCLRKDGLPSVEESMDAGHRHFSGLHW